METLKKKALVTGASRGIGRGIAVKLAASGHHIYVNFAAREDAALETVKLCEAAGGSAEPLKFDVSSSDEVASAFKTIKDKGGLDILVNNAGISLDGLLLRFKDEDWNRTIAVNLSGAFFCAKEGAKLLIKSEAGRIINISSVVGEMGNAGQVAYASAKAGLIGLTKTLARELASRKVTVNAVTPGFIETEMTAGMVAAAKGEGFSQIPLARLGTTDDIAALVGFLASDAASYITGQVIGVNGGMYI